MKTSSSIVLSFSPLGSSTYSFSLEVLPSSICSWSDDDFKLLIIFLVKGLFFTKLMKPDFWFSLSIWLFLFSSMIASAKATPISFLISSFSRFRSTNSTHSLCVSVGSPFLSKLEVTKTLRFNLMSHSESILSKSWVKVVTSFQVTLLMELPSLSSWRTVSSVRSMTIKHENPVFFSIWILASTW